MKITNEFTVNTPIDRAWSVLTDLEGIAPCMPGAQLTGVDGDVYTGKVKVKVGPVVSEFAGTAQFVEKDDTNYRGVIDAKGKDARSAGNAAALITAQLRPVGTSTVVTVDTDLKISGKLAQFGSGMIKEVSGKLLGQFVTQLEAKLAADAPATTDTPPSPTAAAPVDQAGAVGVAGPVGEVEPVVEAAPDVEAGSVGEAAPVGEAEPVGEAVPVGETAPVGVAASADEPVRRPENGPIPDDIALREVAADAEYHASRAAAASGPDSSAAPAGAAASESATVSSEGAAVPEGAVVSQGAAVPEGAVAPDAAGAPEAVAPPAGETVPPPTHRTITSSAEPEALDLMSLAGSSVYKRLVPAVAVVVVVAAVVIWLVVR